MRSDEERQIAEFVAERGVTRGPTLYLVKSPQASVVAGPDPVRHWRLVGGRRWRIVAQPVVRKRRNFADSFVVQR